MRLPTPAKSSSESGMSTATTSSPPTRIRPDSPSFTAPPKPPKVSSLQYVASRPDLPTPLHMPVKYAQLPPPVRTHISSYGDDGTIDPRLLTTSGKDEIGTPVEGAWRHSRHSHEGNGSHRGPEKKTPGLGPMIPLTSKQRRVLKRAHYEAERASHSYNILPRTPSSDDTTSDPKINDSKMLKRESGRKKK